LTAYLLVGYIFYMDTKDTILEVAQRLIQQRGVNGFSYADIAKELGLSKPSLHHHFATKSALVTCLFEKYTEQLITYLSSLDRNNLSAKDKLYGYCDLYRVSLNKERICLGGMLSAEVLTLKPDIKPLLSHFFERQQQWLIQVLEQGETSGELQLTTSANKQATLMIATLQGALVASRATETKEFFDHSVEGLFGSINFN